MTDIVVCNRSATVADSAIAAMLPALQQQISHDFAPFWQADATLHFCGSTEQPDPTHWPLYVLDHSDQGGDLGYHSDDTGTPSAKVFAADDAQYGVSLSVTISHELLEMLADPQANRMAVDNAHLLEVCDPTESDTVGYLISGVLVSDFVVPRYFGLPNPADDPRFDFRALLAGGCPALLPGGYIEGWDGSAWVQQRARTADGAMSYRSGRSGRCARRARRHLEKS